MIGRARSGAKKEEKRREEKRKRKDNAETQSAQSLAEKDGRARTATMFASGTAIQLCSRVAASLAIS